MTIGMKPDLDLSIRTIKTLKRDNNFQQSSVKEVAEMYIAAIGLLYFLKVDQDLLQSTRNKAERENTFAKCPPSADIPAISAVVQDSQLFMALLQCLSTTASLSSQETEASTPAGGGRKRALSFNNSDVSKFLKTSHSPIPGGRKLVDHAVMPHYPVATLAATILYASFAHLDHWPSSLVKAYADDLFGPRLWIDDAHCRLLVRNLELCHQSSVVPVTTAEGMEQAALVAEAYKDQPTSSPANQIRRGSLSSNGSFHEQRKRKRGGSGNSSSSGEEDEEIVLMAKGGDKITRRKASSYPVRQDTLNLESVRPRYYGLNFEAAIDRISSSLDERLDVKSKQNSGLLQALPSFVSISRIRNLIASNLSKWLQSPALAGLARTLFSATVHHMQYEDPPLPDDLLAIDSILAMRLKANQLNAHIENVTAIATRIPTQTVVRHMYSKLLRDEIEAVSSPSHASSESSNFLKMIGAIHAAVPAQVSYDAIASAFLMMMAHQLQVVNDGTSSASKQNMLGFQLRRILRMLSAEISSSFDGIQLTKSFFDFDVKSKVWSPRDEEDKARLMFQCVTLSVSPFVRGRGRAILSETDELKLRGSLLSVRKLFLSWFCTDYGPHYSSRLRKRTDAKRDKESVGAGIPDFRSTLAADDEEKIPSWLNTLRCLLFIEDPESDLMKQFALPDGAASTNDYAKEWETEVEAIKLCCKYGGDLTDELVWIILEASRENGEGLEPEMSIELIENLLTSCTKKREGKITIEDPTLIWEMYNLAQYTPIKDVFSNTEIPSLAYPGIWWRVTVVSLVLCGASGKIADVMWNEHPTLRSLMKMVTSSRYRFPTVDCDDAGRDEAKLAEQKARDEETLIAELLFLSPSPVEEDTSKKAGSRISKRLLKQQKEKDAARLHEERIRRKKMLKAAQKSIMLWDPDGPARKPPREVAELIMAADRAFKLSDEFQRSKDPDFLSRTIGNTTREAVERAYDWLIPIVSKFPEIITRLHSSTSCFLLLRAYGIDADEKKELWELATPLLRHVQESLEGKFGPGASVKAFELLMSDVASHNPDRRRCARRVLQESLPVSNGSSNPGSWMDSILKLRNATYIVPDAVKYMATAASFERGSVLRSLIVSLQWITEYSEKNGIDVSCRYADLVVDLISRRPSVLAEAIDSYTDLRSITIKVVFEEFSACFHATDNSKNMAIFDKTMMESVLQKGRMTRDRVQQIPLPLMRSISVFLSLWKDEFRTIEGASSKYVDALVDALLCQNLEQENEEGASSQQNIAVPVELWIMLAKARSDAIARRAALSAPASFLPRLLLCSGLPKASLLTMIDRLGRLGQRAADMTETYLDLLVPPASSDWDIGRIGTRRQISRKLLGRLTSYMALYGIDFSENNTEISAAFVKWLSQTYLRDDTKTMKAKEKKNKHPRSRPAVLSSLKTVNSVPDVSLEHVHPFSARKGCSEWVEAKQLVSASNDVVASTVVNISEKIEHHDLTSLETTLLSLLEKGTQSTKCEAATVLARSIYNQEHTPENTLSLLLKWFPVLTKLKGTPELWKAVFSVSLCEKVSSSLTLNCIEEWTSSHRSACLDWICRDMHVADDAVHLNNVVRFLVNIIPVPFGSSIQRISVNQSTLDIPAIQGTIKIAMNCLKHCTSVRDSCASLGLDLGLWVSGLGKKSFQLSSNMVLFEMGTGADIKLKPVLSSFLLHLYLKYPSWLDLSSVHTRQLLMEASDLFEDEFSGWNSALDDEIDEAIQSIGSGQFRSVKNLTDIARKHPLILLRKAKCIASILEIDGFNPGRRDDDIRGMVHGQRFDDPREAHFMSRTVKVTVRHWGYSYTEPVWAAFLDVLTSIPKEVLFAHGFRLGLIGFLSPYLQLLLVQLQLQSREKSKRIQSKLADLFQTYQQHKPDEWRRWLDAKIEENEIRHLLVTCGFMTPQQAVESLKSVT